MKLKNKYQGFSAVELLITLFIAATFLIAGSQLYSTIIKDGGSARLEARANNVAYDYLQKIKSDAARIQNPCSSYNFPPEAPVIEGLSDVIVNISISCPYIAVLSLSKVTVTLQYNNNGTILEVKQATLVDGADYE